MKRLLLIACIIVLIGCQSSPKRMKFRPELVRQFEKRGVTDINTEKIILVGSQGGFGNNIQVEITEDFLIDEIWDMIYQSRPYWTRVASGYRKLIFYTYSQPDIPKTKLMVNGTDRCHFEGDFDNPFRCPGINKILRPMLKAEYERKKLLTKSAE